MVRLPHVVNCGGGWKEVVGDVPEGDTVWLAGRRMHDALAGKELTRTDFRVPQLATVDLSGRTVAEVVSRGKHLLTRIGDDLTLHTHFRMEGSWHLYRPGDRWHGGPDWQIRVLLETADWHAVGYRLPVIELLARDHEVDAVGHLGPDLLGPGWDEGQAAEAVRRLGAEPDREIGPALLDQRNLAGVGNLYKTEVCFLVGVSPWTAVRDVDLVEVVDRCRRLLDLNKAHTWQTTTGNNRRGQDHWVFERQRRPCRRCGTTIRSAEQGTAPYQRLSYWCPRCQPGPAPAGSSAREVRPVRPRRR